MNKGQGPYTFMMQDLDKDIKDGDARFQKWFGDDKSKWPFNTQCCATQTYYRMASCSRTKDTLLFVE